MGKHLLSTVPAPKPLKISVDSHPRAKALKYFLFHKCNYMDKTSATCKGDAFLELILCITQNPKITNA